MFLKKYRELSCAQPEDPMDEFKRLRLLENAVINYSGGLVELGNRIQSQKKRIVTSDPTTASLLNDIVTYLR
ncbi:hypothetical protein, partial [Serratia marcescens]|uniref:hypothetical protein n=1 Tax=Serratia marcescens TaxID=615 RepID=UPI001CA38324